MRTPEKEGGPAVASRAVQTVIGNDLTGTILVGSSPLVNGACPVPHAAPRLPSLFPLVGWVEGDTSKGIFLIESFSGFKPYTPPRYLDIVETLDRYQVDAAEIRKDGGVPPKIVYKPYPELISLEVEFLRAKAGFPGKYPFLHMLIETGLSMVSGHPVIQEFLDVRHRFLIHPPATPVARRHVHNVLVAQYELHNINTHTRDRQNVAVVPVVYRAFCHLAAQLSIRHADFCSVLISSTLHDEEDVTPETRQTMRECAEDFLAMYEYRAKTARAILDIAAQPLTPVKAYPVTHVRACNREQAGRPDGDMW